MAKKVKDLLPGAFDSTYTSYSSAPNLSSLGAPAFTATIRLGDNSAVSGGVSELILNGVTGQLAWGVNGSGDVDSDINYPVPPTGIYCPVDLIIPASSSPQTPAGLTVGNAPTIQYTGSSYGAITNVFVQAMVTLGSMPIGCLSVQWFNLSIVFTDADSDQTTNPTDMTSCPSALLGTGCSKQINIPGKGKGLRTAWNNVATQALLATPASSFSGAGAVSVELQGGIRLLSTDGSFKNYSAISSAAMYGKILVWTS